MVRDLNLDWVLRFLNGPRALGLGFVKKPLHLTVNARPTTSGPFILRPGSFQAKSESVYARQTNYTLPRREGWAGRQRSKISGASGCWRSSRDRLRVRSRR